MNSSKKIKLIIAFSLIAFLSNIAFLHSTNAQAEEIIIKNDDPLTEINTRKQILNNVLDTSKSEINDLKNDLDKLDFKDNEDWDKIKNNLIDQLSQSQNYYEKISDKLNNGQNTLEDIKNIAKDLKDWRENVYSSQMEKITNMLLIFQNESLLKTGQDRLDKISNDLKKIEKQRYIKSDPLKIYYSQAENKLNNANSFNSKAKDLFYKNSIQKIEYLEDSEESANTDSKNPNTQNSIRNLIKSSLKNLKAAYELFFQMNSKIVKLI